MYSIYLTWYYHTTTKIYKTIKELTHSLDRDIILLVLEDLIKENSITTKKVWSRHLDHTNDAVTFKLEDLETFNQELDKLEKNNDREIMVGLGSSRTLDITFNRKKQEVTEIIDLEKEYSS